jgi:pimeloyl-ACP methyl ester carboxylesterase
VEANVPRMTPFPPQCEPVVAGDFHVLRQIPGAGSITLEGEIIGEGPPVVLLHGLSATRRNVVQGSRALVKRGYRLISYDARGHGESSPAPSYHYSDLVADLETVLEKLALERAALVGSSMGAATALAFALEHPERVPALVQITPAYTGYARTGDADGETWEKLAAALDEGVDEFVRVAQPEGLPERWRDVAREASRQRMERHSDLTAVAQALREVPRSIAWKGLDVLSELDVPVLIVGSQDDSDWLHPLGVAEEYCRKLPNCELVVEDKGQSPLAWQGARLSNTIADFLERVGYS